MLSFRAGIVLPLFVVLALAGSIARTAEASEGGWRFGPRAGLLVYDLDPNDRQQRPRRVQSNALVGASAIWLHDANEPGWQAGVETGLWLQLLRDDFLDRTVPTMAAPVLARLQYDFDLMVLRYQMGISLGLPLSDFRSPTILAGAIVGGGVDVPLGETVGSLDFLFESSPLPVVIDDGFESYISIYMLNLGVSW